MERTDRSATAMPMFIVVLAVTFWLLRCAGGVVAANTRNDFSNPIKWTDAARSDYLPMDPDGKLVVYQFYANWSDPCKQMDQAAFNNRQVMNVIEENFVPVRVTDNSRELAKNPQWLTDMQKHYRVFALPTLVVADANGNQVGTLVGNCSSLTTYRFLSRIMHRKV